MTATPSKSRAPRAGSAKPRPKTTDAATSAGRRETNVLLKTLVAFKKGNFRVRMPVDLVGIDGKVADAINDILELNQRWSTSSTGLAER